MYYVGRLLDILTAPLRALLYAPGRLFAGSQRVLGISLPARVASLTAVFLVICVAVVLVAFWVFTPNHTFASAKLNPGFITVITLLVVVIPFVLYKALKLWLEGDVSPFPDIDHAWKAGLAELEQHGLNLSQTPLFLVLGSAGEDHEKALFEASRLNLNMREIPQGPAPLHWYANPDGIYLVCTDTSGLSKLSHMAAEVTDREAAGPLPPVQASSGGIRGTIVAGVENPAPQPSASVPAPSSTGEVQPNIRGTMVVGSQSSIGSGAIAQSAERHVVKLEPADGKEQDRRLEYVCRLIRRARQPLCPINGILTLLPFGLIQRSVPEGIEVQRAVKKDLASVLRVLMLRCPVTAVVVGLEQESGFQELVRRVGRDRALSQRFGRGFTIWNPPISERLEALAAHACGSFEDWVYTLFRETGALSKPGNTRLYSLLCKIRRNVQSRLANIMVAGYGMEAEQDQRATGLLFGGCYFAATGQTEDRQAFVKGVFDKLPEQQEELEWTGDAFLEDQKYQQFAQLGLAADTLLLLGLMGMIVYKWFW